MGVVRAVCISEKKGTEKQNVHKAKLVAEDVYKRQVHSAFIRTDDHQVILVHFQIRLCAEQSFHKLIWRCKVIESFEWNCILYTWVVRIKCDDIRYTHCCKFF